MKSIHYCNYCEQEVEELFFVDDSYTNYDEDSEAISVEYQGICMECHNPAKYAEQSNYNYHRGLLI